MKVQDVMTRDVAACGVGDDLAAAGVVMWNRDCGAVPIVDGEGVVVGMITDRDICMSVVLRRRLAHEISVGEVMSGNVRSCAPVDDIRDALRIMQDEKLRRLPVVEADGTLCGILSISDIVRHAEKGKSKKHVSHKEAMTTLKAISEPRIFGEDDGAHIEDEDPIQGF